MTTSKKRRIGDWDVYVGLSRGGSLVAYVDSPDWSDSGSIGHDKVMRWDFPERIPRHVRDAAYGMLERAKKRGKSKYK